MQLIDGVLASRGRFRRFGIALLALAATVAGCTSSPSSADKSTAHAAAGSGSPVAPSRLAAILTHGLAELGSAHLDLRTTLSGQQLSGSGDIEMTGGTVKAADVSQQLPGGLGAVEILVADHTTYAELPPALSTGDKPWVIVDHSSSSPVVDSLSSVIDTVLAIVTPQGLIGLTKAAGKVTGQGGVVVDGTHTTHYTLRAGPSALQTAVPGLGGGSGPVTLQVYVDSAGRPVRVASVFRILGQRVSPNIVLSRFGETLSINAPPASDVSRT